MKNFFATTLKSLGQTGTICPSSKYLISEITQNIEFDNVKNIVEFGTGEGCITKVLLNRMPKNAELYSFEINEDFYRFSTEKFKDHDNFQIIKESALDFDKVKGISEINSVDYIISSLPLTLFEEEEIDLLLKKVRRALKPNGRFIQYQYSLGKWIYFKNLFNEVKLDYTMLNFPPAVVYTCTM